jgi:GNAT superfamily N-acetyltransferase
MEILDIFTSNDETFTKELAQFVLPASKDPCRPERTIVTAICGSIGKVSAPTRYCSAPFGRVFVLYQPGEPKVMVGYAAVRFCAARRGSAATFVIDVLGVHPEYRQRGLGEQLYRKLYQQIVVNPEWRSRLEAEGCLKHGAKYTVSLQAVYSAESYRSALLDIGTLVADHTNPENNKYSVNMCMVAERLSGSCEFWQRMGFDCKKLIVSDPGIPPVLMMWFCA